MDEHGVNHRCIGLIQVGGVGGGEIDARRRRSPGADGPTPEIVAASPAFAPQVAKILAPLRYLTVAEVADALDPSPALPAMVTP